MSSPSAVATPTVSNSFTTGPREAVARFFRERDTNIMGVMGIAPKSCKTINGYIAVPRGMFNGTNRRPKTSARKSVATPTEVASVIGYHTDQPVPVEAFLFALGTAFGVRNRGKLNSGITKRFDSATLAKVLTVQDVFNDLLHIPSDAPISLEDLSRRLLNQFRVSWTNGRAIGSINDKLLLARGLQAGSWTVVLAFAKVSEGSRPSAKSVSGAAFVYNPVTGRLNFLDTVTSISKEEYLVGTIDPNTSATEAIEEAMSKGSIPAHRLGISMFELAEVAATYGDLGVMLVLERAIVALNGNKTEDVKRLAAAAEGVDSALAIVFDLANEVRTPRGNGLNGTPVGSLCSIVDRFGRSTPACN